MEIILSRSECREGGLCSTKRSGSARQVSGRYWGKINGFDRVDSSAQRRSAGPREDVPYSSSRSQHVDKSIGRW